ncbi:glycine zipper 2TM domain-containing protein [Massilia sp. CCM 9210]|uniref:glycine zipper 2TM domain-containing protein n=1 Tax=Massilia scottii TaxID=3057166 RepID=UPI0027969489|nr:glycine zipper 2TM domain-containing protein [Massilia sp. CCM 9210]MDQ1815837.1 glycine zipper 2TM domain-containing protein [Massilia sp. CCM 9210]
MEQINTASRIHPLMAAAALSVIALSVAGTAAITGLLPSSKADTSAVATAPQQLTAPQALAALPSPALAAQPAPTAQQLADAQMLVAKYSPQAAQPRPAPEEVYEKPVVKKVVHTPRRAPQQTRVAQHQAPNYRAQPAQPAQQASQPNYVGIGAGAVIGGLLGNQIGGGRGKKLATVAGAIGGGFLGNEIANRNK